MNIFFQLLKTDLKLFRKNIKDKTINVIIWSAALCTIATYILPAFGTSQDYSVLEALGIVIGVIGFETNAQIFLLLADLEGDRHLSYYFILPLSNFLIFVRLAILYTINGLFLCILTIPVIKLILGNRLDLTQIHVPYFIITLLITNLFFSFFSFLLLSFIKNIEQCENVLMRVLFPLWFFGGFSFSFKIALQTAPFLAYISLISPYTYATEAIRSASLGPLEYLPIEISFGVLILMTVLAGFFGIKRLKNKLDFI